MQGLDKQKNKLQAGFTLLEVLISIVILSLLMLSIFSIVDSSMTTQQTITNEDREVLQLESAFSRFAIDYTQIWSPLFHSAIKKKNSNKKSAAEDSQQQKYEPTLTFPLISKTGHPIPIVDNPNKSELIFFTISNRRKVQGSKQSNFAWAQYKIQKTSKKKSTEFNDDDERGADFELIRRYSSHNPYAEEFNWDKVKAHVLMKNIKSFKFEFWNKKSKKFVDSLRDIGSSLYLPSAVKVSITWVDMNKFEHLASRVFRPLWPVFDTSLDEDKKGGGKSGKWGDAKNAEADLDDEEDEENDGI